MTTRQNTALLAVEELSVRFSLTSASGFGKARTLWAVDQVTLSLQQGEVLGVAGESGCGKSTLVRAILGLLPAAGGRVLFEGTDITTATGTQRRRVHQQMQLVFQDPYASLDPRMRLADIVAEPLRNFRLAGRREARRRALELMECVGLAAGLATRFPHELSGGQRQRVGIARALAVQPKLLFCDEPVSSLDVSIQAQIVNLLRDLQQRFDLTIVFISHDLSIVRHISDRIAIMYLGRIVEIAAAEALYDHPRHPYTRALLSAVPIPDPVRERSRQRPLLSGDAVSTATTAGGCAFAPRCPLVREQCRQQEPPLQRLEETHYAACFRAAEATPKTL